MTDLENRVRYALHTLADTVPPSPDPRADLERRLGRRRPGRGQALVAVAAAAVVVAVAGVAIPLATHRDPVERSAAPPGDGLVWSSDYGWLDAEAGPDVLGTFERDGETVDAVAWMRGGELCVGEGHHVAVGGTSGQTPAALVGVTCDPVPAVWPGGPTNSLVVTRSVLGEGAIHSGPVPGLLLFLTAPQVTTLEVRSGDGSRVTTRELDSVEGMRLFLADFGAPPWGFGYTATDARGTVLESAIT
jgi:hypothetical protein